MHHDCRSIKRATARTLLFCAAAACSPAAAHHAGTEYDMGKVVEIEGTLIELQWRNPHVRLKVRTEAGGKPVVWDIEGSAVSSLRRSNATPEKLHVGDKIRVAGEPWRRGPGRMFALHLLQADGTELVFFPGLRPRWATTAAGTGGSWMDPGTTENAAAGLFRVWSTKLDDMSPFWRREYPLTAAARQKRAAWDATSDTVLRGCEPKGMPTIMETPYPLEFVLRKDVILLRMEEYDTVRTIHMGAKVNRASLPPSRVGRSTGHWEGTTLVVRTDAITWPHLDQEGTPLSGAASLLERFKPSADGTRLSYSVVITDPQVMSAPVKLERHWVARPNESVGRYDCTI